MSLIKIVGKNASILTFPKEMLIHDSIGINHAAWEFNTTQAFTVYPFLVKEALQHGIPANRIVGGKPAFKIPGQFGKDDWPNESPGLSSYIRCNNRDIKWEAIPEDVAASLRGDTERVYHNFGTCLHQLIYWCVIQKYSPIYLFGCNQDKNCLPQYFDPMEHSSDRYKYLMLMIAEFGRQSYPVIFCKDYHDYCHKRDEMEAANAFRPATIPPQIPKARQKE